jgi:hypothetical protein
MGKQNNINTLLIIGVIILIIFGFSQGWFKNIFTFNIGGNNINLSTPTPDNVDPYTPYTVSLNFNPNPTCVGDSVMGSIDSNIPNGVCTLFFMEDGWEVYDTFNLDINGDVSASQVISVPGTTNLRAVCCDLNGNCKISNIVDLVVRFCSSPPPESGPEDESWCYDSDAGSEQYNIQGHCEDSFSSVGYSDTCDGGFNKEYYCGTDNHCYFVKMDCNPGICSNGRCVYQACSSIGRPISQSSCDRGICSTGACKFYPATLTMAARCGCG